MADQPAADNPKRSFLSQVGSMNANFWVACLMEIFERLAFYGVRAIAPLYLVAKSSDNGLALSYSDRGVIYGVWAFLQCIIPMVSGGYTERYGYRKSLVIAFFTNIVGYLVMAQSKPLADYFVGQGWEGAPFWIFMAGACLIGTGTAIFKPPAHGTIAAATDEETSSLGWGIFYWVVNIGGALAPMGAAVLRAEIDWQNVFYAAAIVTAFNFLPLFVLYREPKREIKAEDKGKSPLQVFSHSIITMCKDARLLVFMGIFSCFWLMFMQLWDLLPNFIDEWVDSSDVAAYFAWINAGWVQANGQVKPEMIINLDSLAIIAMVLFVSWMIRKIHKVAAMIMGMIIALVGFVGTGATTLGYVCCLMVIVFAIGEMMCSPTFSAYIGLIAPKDKKAMYLGYSNVPFAIGWLLGSLIGGYVYDSYGARDHLALKHIVKTDALLAPAARAADWSDSLQRLPELLHLDRSDALTAAAEAMKQSEADARKSLRVAFRHDRGQLQNLAIVYLARHQEDQETFKNALAETLTEQEDNVDLIAVGKSLKDHSRKLVDVDLPSIVHLVPSVLRVKPDTAMDTIRDNIVNQDKPIEEYAGLAEVEQIVWDEVSNDPGVINNFALEYLAQATRDVSHAAALFTYESPETQTKQRIEELSSKFSISGGEAVDVLGAALSASVDAHAIARDKYPGSSLTGDDLLYRYLAESDEYRIRAISQRTWSKDLHFLRDLIASDNKASKLVREELADVGAIGKLARSIKNLLSTGSISAPLLEDGINYNDLAGDMDLVQRALKVKDWSQTPDQAAKLLMLNPYEARALVVSDTKATQKLLWDTYNPAIVWFILGGLGLVGTAGMYVFYLATKNKAGSDGGGVVAES